jgi:hypothetical protein
MESIRGPAKGRALTPPRSNPGYSPAHANPKRKRGARRNLPRLRTDEECFRVRYPRRAGRVSVPVSPNQAPRMASRTVRWHYREADASRSATRFAEVVFRFVPYALG